MSFGLPGPLQTAFELKLDLPASNNLPDAATLKLHALISNLEGRKHQNTFSDFSIFSQIKGLANLGGLYSPLDVFPST